MGLEAISRGAREAVMIDRAKDAVSVIKKNVAKTKFESECKVFCIDYSEYIRRFSGEKFDIVFLDPPYAAGLYGAALSALLEADMLKSTTIIVCESDTKEIFAKDASLAERFTEVKVSKYSKTVITLLSPKGE